MSAAAGGGYSVPSRQVVATLLAIWLTHAAVSAQTPEQSVFPVQGTVTDWKDSPVAGATVRLQGLDHARKNYQVRTGKDGVYVFPAILPGTYRATIMAEGFPPWVRDVDLHKPLPAPADVKLQVLVSERIEVRPLDAGNRNLSSMTLSAKDLEGIPTSLLYQRLRELAGATGRPDSIPIYIDGFKAGLRMLPKDAIELIRINGNAFAAEFPELTDGRIEITTKPGVDDAHGQFQFDFNDDALNARDAFAPRKPPVQMRTYNAYASTPIVRNRLGLLGSFGRWEQDQNQVINATVVQPSSFVVAPFVANSLSPTRTSNAFLQANYLAAASHSVALSYSRTEEHARNLGLESGRALPEYGFDRNVFDHTTRLAIISTLGTRMLNELRVEWNRRKPETQALDSRPAIIVFDAFSAGGNQGAFFKRDEKDVVQVANHLTRAFKDHTLKTGVELKIDRLENLDRSDWGGTFIFGTDVERDAIGRPLVDARGQTASIAPVETYRRTLLGLPGYGPAQFSIVRGNPLAEVSQWEFAWFAQDDWRPSQGLTLSYGLRSEAQTNLRRRPNLGPRVGVVWSTDEKTQSTFRGGAGLFYGRVDPQLTMEAVRLDGERQREIVIPRPAFFPELPENLEAVPSSISSVRVKASDLGQPYTFATSLSYERQLPLNIFGSLEYRAQKGNRLLRMRRLGGTETTRVPVFQFESTGSSMRHDLVAGMRTYIKGQQLFASYTLSSYRNDTDGASTLPADSTDLARELGWAAFDQRHNLVLSGTVTLAGTSVSSFVTLATGKPFNITTGRDNNADTVFTDRPSYASPGDPEATQTAFGWLNPSPRPGERIIPRNLGRGAGEINISVYAMRAIRLSKTPVVLAADGARPPREYGLVLSASAENLINRTNLIGYNSVLTSSAFGLPIRAMGPRRIQLSASFNF